MQDGTRCVCQHPHAFHCDGPAGQHLGGCPVAECDCEAFIEDVFTGIQPRETARATTGVTDQDAWEQAVRSETARANHGDGDAWERAVTCTGTSQSSHKQSQSRRSPNRDQAVLDAVRELGGDPNDPSA
jgi:hypothetical protein